MPTKKKPTPPELTPEPTPMTERQWRERLSDRAEEIRKTPNTYKVRLRTRCEGNDLIVETPLVLGRITLEICGGGDQGISKLCRRPHGYVDTGSILTGLTSWVRECLNQYLAVCDALDVTMASFSGDLVWKEAPPYTRADVDRLHSKEPAPARVGWYGEPLGSVPAIYVDDTPKPTTPTFDAEAAAKKLRRAPKQLAVLIKVGKEGGKATLTRQESRVVGKNLDGLLLLNTFNELLAELTVDGKTLARFLAGLK